MSVTRGRRGAHVAPVRAMIAAAGGLIILVVLAAAWLVRAPLPKLDGATAVAGISHEVVIRRDARGIPHIIAVNESDAFFGQGFACAQDRLWQMDLLRREAEGSLSEIFGSLALSVDTYYRTIGLGAVADESIRRLTARDRALLDAYSAGVNAAAFGHALPLEFRLLGYKPVPWTPRDSLAVGLLITRDQDDNWQQTLLRADLRDKLGAAAAAALTDNQLDSLEEYVPGYARGPASRASQTHDDRGGWWTVATGPDPPQKSDHQGSNNWTVGPSRTDTGKPVLSNDTHLDHTLPSTWWISQIEGGSFDVEGFTLPGVPGVIIGHNRRIAFGVTSAAEDVEDLFVERFSNAHSDSYLANGRWVQAQHRVERIKIKGQPDAALDVLITRHGPVVKRAGTKALALSWTVLRDGVTLSAVDDYDRAGNWQEFRSALSEFIGPTLNFAYADVDGHIAYQDAGRVPLRASGDGSVPVEGQDDRYAWRGEVPFDRLPRAIDPARGFLATANNQLVPAGFSPSLSRDFLSPYRVHEVVRRLSEPGRRSPQAIGAIQADAFDYPRKQLSYLAQSVVFSDPHLAKTDYDIAARLHAWDGMTSPGATEPTFLAELDRALEDRLLVAKIGAPLDVRYDKEHHFITPLLRVLYENDPRLRGMGITRQAVKAAMVPAVHDAEEQLGLPGRRLISWGEVNAAIYDHPLGQKWPLTILNAPRIPQPGDPFCVFQSKPNFGPSMRLVADLSNWDNTSMLLTLGESGVWTDAHYDDMERDWVNVGWSPTPFTDAAVIAAAADTLRLEPTSPK